MFITTEESIRLLGDEINEINVGNGWDVCTPQDWPANDAPLLASDVAGIRKIGTTIALIHTEVSEAMEALRKRDRANFEEELADVVIRVLDCSHGLGIDLGPVIAAKLLKNRRRGFRHGGKAI